MWAATKLATDAGGWRQINRAGHPMMWPIFWPDDTDFTNPANTRHPSEDVGAAARYTGEQITAVVAAAGTSDDPEAYGQAVAGQLFPDVLPYVAGHPRGLRVRRLQRPDPGRQRPRSDAVPGHRHRRALRAHPSHHQAPAVRHLPLRRPRLTTAPEGDRHAVRRPATPGSPDRTSAPPLTADCWKNSRRRLSSRSRPINGPWKESKLAHPRPSLGGTCLEASVRGALGLRRIRAASCRQPCGGDLR